MGSRGGILRHREEGQVTTNAETEVMSPQAEEHQESTESRKGKEGLRPFWHLNFRAVASRTLRK